MRTLDYIPLVPSPIPVNSEYEISLTESVSVTAIIVYITKPASLS